MMNAANAANQQHRMIGAIDMGSKNFKFVVGHEIDGVITTELIRKESLQLGKEVSENNGLIGKERIYQVSRSLSWFVLYCRERGASEVLGVTASAIRNARNYEQVRDLAYVLGVNLEVADGAREGEIGYFAATGGASNKLVTEVGSKSMQITWDSAGAIRSQSVSVGYEQAYEAFIENQSTLRNAERMFCNFLDGNFSEVPDHTDEYLALAANTTTSFVTSKMPRGSEMILDKDALDATMAGLRSLSPSEFNALKTSLPKANKIFPGLIFIQYIMERSGHNQMVASPNELPVGLVVEYFLNLG